MLHRRKGTAQGEWGCPGGTAGAGHSLKGDPRTRPDGGQAGAMQVSGGAGRGTAKAEALGWEHARVSGNSKKGISVNNWGRGRVASKPLQPFGLSLELPHMTGFEGDPSCEDPHLPPK